ncbi:MAG: HD-GYP domain-containing protein [Planctomycetota bacterium]
MADSDGEQSGTDESIAKRLADEIGAEVQLASDGESSELIVAAQTSQTVVTAIESDAVRQAVVLPGGRVAYWVATVEDAQRLARHAQCFLELVVQGGTVASLNAEVESLTNQVMQDFEELALIRTLASTLALPESAEDTSVFVLDSLRPLSHGVNAASIAAVLCDDGTAQSRREPLWTGDQILSKELIFRLIDQHADEARQQPVVYNRRVSQMDWLEPVEFGDAALNEFIMVECSSEGRIHGWVLACNRIGTEGQEDVPWAQLGFTTVQASLMETATNQLAAQLNNIRLLRQKEELFTDVIRALVNAVEARDPYTCGHSERVASFARFLGSAIGFTPADCERIYLTGLLHDVGKIAIPDGVLQKPSRLDDQERAIIETHTDSGWRILHELDALQDVLPGVLYHHEHWNGCGYPDQLEGENIPIDGRILAVCDAFDAMTSDRPYRKGMSIEKAVDILKGGAGSYWDPHLIRTFVDNIDEVDQIRLDHRPRQPPTRPAPVNGKPVIGTAGYSAEASPETL